MPEVRRHHAHFQDTQVLRPFHPARALWPSCVTSCSSCSPFLRGMEACPVVWVAISVHRLAHLPTCFGGPSPLLIDLARSPLVHSNRFIGLINTFVPIRRDKANDFCNFIFLPRQLPSTPQPRPCASLAAPLYLRPQTSSWSPRCPPQWGFHFCC